MSLSIRTCQPAVDLGDLFRPSLPLTVLKVHDILSRPVKVIGDIGYLLVQAIEGVAYDPPRSVRSTSISDWQLGQVTGKILVPCSLICR
jgi:hypothetical protein